MKLIVVKNNLQIDVCDPNNPHNINFVFVDGSIPNLLEFNNWQELMSNYNSWTTNIVLTDESTE